MNSRPRPGNTDATGSAELQGDQVNIKILEGAEGYSLGQGRVGALFCHGFSSSPQNMRFLADHLAERGIAVRATLLPGHGTTW